MAISFGTDGWRGIISKDFTFANAEIVAQAYSEYVLREKRDGKKVIVGYDSRFLSAEYAGTVAQVLAANGIPVLLTEKITPTPVISLSIKQLSLYGGLIITASHNPAEYNGIKIKGWYGGSATPEIMLEISGYLHKTPVKRSEKRSLIEPYNCDKAYMDHLKTFVNLELIKKSGLKVLVDPMYGAGRGYLKYLLESLNIDVSEIHSDTNPGFGGINPEPVEQNLKELRQNVVNGSYSVGLATDGDADRVGAIDEDGTNINAQQIFTIILWHHLSQNRECGGIGKTFSTTKMVDKIAKRFGIQVWETPIGFKHLVKLFLQNKIFIGGEESGGIGIQSHLPERDGILNSLLLLEAMACHGKTLRQLINQIMEKIGPHYFRRIDLPLKDRNPVQVIGYLKSFWNSQCVKQKNLRLEELDGLKVIFNPSRWLLFRPSGTEPLIRIYAEAESPERVAELLRTGTSLLEAS